MTVYLAFNEAEGLDSCVPSEVTSTTVTSVSGVATHGWRFNNLPVSGNSEDSTFTALTEGWFHCYFDLGQQTSNTNGSVISIKDTSGAIIVDIKRAGFGVSNAASDLHLDTPNTTAYVLAQNDNGPFTIDVNLKLNSTTGFIRVYLGGLLIYEENNVDTTVTSGVTQFDTITFSDPGSYLGTTTNPSLTCNFGQILVSDEITTGCKVYTLYQTAGSINDWDTGTATLIDERDVDDSDKATTTTNGDQITVDTSVTLSAPSGVNSYTAVVTTYRANYDSGSPVTDATPLLNDTTATGTYYGTALGLTTGLSNYHQVWNTDPSDASAWDATKINGYEFGLRADT